MNVFKKHTLIFFLLVSCTYFCKAQLVITSQSNAQALVQKLLGQGVQVSNITLTADTRATGIFHNISGTQIGIDSGIVLTNGAAKTDLVHGIIGVDGNGIDSAHSLPALANLQQYPLSIPSGDQDLADLIGVPVTETHDACVLEFDFVPLGDTVKFNYVFSSEEYYEYVCQFNDAFAFFIRGPGITGNQNIAIIPGTIAPVTINNINDQPPCSGAPVYPQFYVPNYRNLFFTHNGHTKILTALSRVQPCQTYHLKMVIADLVDGEFDSGVFLEAGSLSSNAIQIHNLTQTDPGGNSYLVEGCATGSFKVKRNNPSPTPLPVNLSYGGTAINGVDVELLPTSVTIPANDTVVTISVVPIIDNIPEGIETLVIYALAGCTAGTPTDSAIIQIRDYDILGLTPDTAFICKHSSIQLNASVGYTTYAWDANPTLSSLSIPNPIANPVNNSTTYYCTAKEGTCNARDSSFIKWKLLQLTSKTDVNCHGAFTGDIKVTGGIGWTRPVTYSINNTPYQADSTFSNLPAGTYTVRIKDAVNCIDSLVINIVQAFPDLLVTDTTITQASCAGNPDGTVTLHTTGGNNPYGYSLDGINFQSMNQFNLLTGNYLVTVKDNNGCIATQNVFIPLNNIVTLDMGAAIHGCIGRSYTFTTASNGDSFLWSPATNLNNNTLLNPIVSIVPPPLTSTPYLLTATTGICSRTGTVNVFANPSPIADAGPDSTICFGKSIQLNGSGGTVYRWSPNTFLDRAGISNPMVKKPYNTITYYLSVGNAYGCASLQKDSVTITVIPQATVFAGRDTTMALNQPLPLSAIDVHNSKFITYTWDPPYGLSDPLSANPVALPSQDITYTVTANTVNGCEASDNIFIKIYRGPDIYVPNAFTPNGDGLNDILKPIPVGIKSFNYFRIYNRWGKVVFSTADALHGWDGKLNGITSGTETYIWIAEAIDYKGNTIQRKGTITVIR